MFLSFFFAISKKSEYSFSFLIRIKKNKLNHKELTEWLTDTYIFIPILYKIAAEN